jgi:hypothetical protein
MERNVDYLLEVLNRAPTELRVAAARHLGELGAIRAVNPLVRALRSSDLILRVASIKALGSIGGSDAADAVAAAGGDNELAVQSTAAVALVRLGDERATEILVRLASRRDRLSGHSRRWAIRRLAESATPLDCRTLDGMISALSSIDRFRLRKSIAALRSRVNEGGE